jgi:hypothetical protein
MSEAGGRLSNRRDQQYGKRYLQSGNAKEAPFVSRM